MDLRYLKTFSCVAEQASFTRAAEILGYSQSTVSFQIKQLEEELNVRLFERIGHTTVLTAHGREVLDYAHRIDQMSQSLHRSLQGDEAVKGHIRLATADSLIPLIFGNRFAGFRQQYPDITIKVFTAGTEELFRLLNHNEADLLMTLDSHIYQAEYKIASEEKISVHFVVSPKSLLAARGDMKLQELLEEPFLLTEKGMSYRRILDEILAADSLEIKPVFETGDTALLTSLAEQGLGISLLPDHVTEDSVRAGRLVRLNVTDVQIDVWRQLICHKDKWISPAMKAAIDYFSGK